MNNNKFLLSALAVAGTVVVAGSSFAFMGFGSQGAQGNRESREVNTELRTQLNEALVNNDYDAFVEVSKHNITEEQFATIVAKYKEREAKRAEQEAYHTKVDAAIEAGDYTTWASLEKNEDVLAVVTADNFSDFQHFHALQKEARALAEKLGLPQHREMRGEKGMRGHHEHMMEGKVGGRGMGQAMGMMNDAE